MIIARTTSADGAETILLGVTRENIDRLLDGFPIRLTPETHGLGIPVGWRVLIFFGETERAIAQALKSAGAIGADTKVMAMPRTADDEKPPS